MKEKEMIEKISIWGAVTGILFGVGLDPNNFNILSTQQSQTLFVAGMVCLLVHILVKRD